MEENRPRSNRRPHDKPARGAEHRTTTAPADAVAAHPPGAALAADANGLGHALLALHAPPTLQIDAQSLQVQAWHGDLAPYLQPGATLAVAALVMELLQPAWQSPVAALLARMPRSAATEATTEDKLEPLAGAALQWPPETDRLIRPVLRRLDCGLLLSFEPADIERLPVQDAEAQLRLILESTAEGLFGVDEAGRLRFANPAACTMLGWQAEGLMGRPYDTLMRSAEDARALVEVLHDGVPTREAQAVFRHRDGHRVPVVYAARAMWRGERIVGAVVSFSDISERLAAERARETALGEAERLARARTEFLANMSHEIRTPLNAVLGLAEVATRGDRDRPAEETFRMILDSGQVLLHVVNDILDFSKMEAGKLRVESQLFELGQVIDRAVALVAPRVFAKGLHFRVDERPGLPARLRGDALRLTQVLGNLLSNALKFTESGTIELIVRRDERDLWFSVSDTGIGIPNDRLSRLFKPFEQVDSSTTRRHGGTGLGLVISRHLMALMGGSIGVHSRPGEGSTFAARLPLLDTEMPAPPAEGETIVLAGLRDLPLLDHIAPTLRDLGFVVHERAAQPATFDSDAALTALHTDALREEPFADAAASALERGQRVAVLTHPMAAELPPALRGRVALIEQPVRVRHLVTARVPPPMPTAPGPAELGGRLGGLQLLAAEDNEVNALVLEAIMRMEGAQLELVENGRLAVELLRQRGPGHFHLVLTDIQMPEMDGYGAAREIRLLDPTLPVVGLTAHAMPEERERCLKAGMVDHLAKPIEVEPLVAAILRHSRKP